MLGELVRDGIAPLSASLNLDPTRVWVAPILNWGGFVNRSFKVTDGQSAYHLKLSSDPKSLFGLERWRSLSQRLSGDYHAPMMMDWLDLPVAGLSGPLFEWVEGETPGSPDQSVLKEVTSVVSRLHEDADLAAELARLGDSIGTCAEAYASEYHERFTEDLKLIHSARPPFVNVRDAEWMAREAAALLELVEASQAFQDRAEVPAHRDLWPNNVLVTLRGSWYLLDWDGLALGDAVMDWTMLFGPSRSDPRPVSEARLARLPLSASQRTRVPLYARASLLDWIIDPLADWIEAAHHPLHGQAIRDANRRVHERARALYGELYE